MWNRRYADAPAGNTRQITGCTISIGDAAYKTHRILWLLVRGEPVPEIIDHMDGDPFNNRISNLRAATRAQNNWNRRRGRDNTSGVKGVILVKEGVFRVSLRHNGERYVRTYKSIEEAAGARNEMARLLHGDFARDG
jgi:hypothetical protein